VLAPDQQIGIENLSIFFTDLKGSTSLYEEIGETSTFNRVRTHFQFLTQRIRRHEGAIVKTIGDAVMAVFSLLERAIQAALEIQSEIEDFNRSLALDPPLIIKIGIHHGPAIAVNANDRLDYFGRTVNIAARVQRESLGGDVVLTQELFQDPRVQKVLRDFQIKVNTFQTALKGIEGTFTLCRLCLSRPQVL
jgi:class 3 adenylate cyclase